MRAVFGLVALLLAAALVLSLSGRDATRAIRSVRRAIPGLEERAEPRPLDRQAASALATRLRQLAQDPAPPEAELEAAADTAAAWAAGGRAGTRFSRRHTSTGRSRACKPALRPAVRLRRYFARICTRVETA